ncbi:MFS transporter [Nonomuraea soli]|uniref:MFS family permease n=1 Tax=Nonomuraea soli TaxID=1032476 RepID=A0A7W0CMU1_9ACTN|nr:MFS transporter [Nonomuraea soli]MBA2894003.1 MFS family permease [Nonomuraea soli]
MVAQESLWRNAAYRRYLGADVLSQFGTQVTLVALPLVALITLDATPFQLGLLTAVEMIPFLLVGLPAGVWVDRMRRRPILIVTDLVRAAALGSVPLAAVLGHLTLPHLYVVALVVGVCAVFFDVAHMSFLPSIIDKGVLAKAIGMLESLRSVAGVAGPGVGGAMVQILTAPIALAADALSYLASAFLLRGLKAAEKVRPAQERRSLRAELLEGIRYVLGHPILRRVAMVGGLNMLANGFWAVVQPLFLIDEIGVSAAVYGLIVSTYGIGGVVGALIAPKVVERFGLGRAMYGGALLAMVFPLIIPFSGPGWQLALYPLGTLTWLIAAVVFNVGQASYRQAVTPDHLRGRMNASMRFLMWSMMPIGSVLAGLLAESLPISTMLWITCLIVTAAHLPITLHLPTRDLKL